MKAFKSISPVDSKNLIIAGAHNEDPDKFASFFIYKVVNSKVPIGVRFPWGLTP